jgi:hypothetical protein
MFVAGFFYFLLVKENIYWASLFALGASATRPVGLSLLIVLAVYYFYSYKAKKSWADILAFITSGLGLVVYMIYLKTRFADPLIFLQAQKGWRGGIGGNFVVNLWTDLFKLVPKEATINWALLFFERISLPLVILAGLYLILKYKKKYLELSVYLAISIALPILTGTFGSLNRLVIVIFPVFFAIALLLKRRPIIFLSYILTSQAFLIFWTIFYTHSKWTG